MATSRLNTARPSPTRTERPPRQTSGPPSKPSKPSQGRTANRARQADPVPGRGGPSAAGVRARREPEPAVIAVTLVRAESVRHRKPLVLGGHERSRPANQNRRSHAIHRHDLGRRSSVAPGSNPSASSWRGLFWGAGRRTTILPVLCPTDPHRAVRTWINTGPNRPGSTRTARCAFTLLSREHPAQTNEPGRIWMRRTRLTPKVGGSIPSLPTTSGQASGRSDGASFVRGPPD
jgi:hypothetical protein